MPLNLRRTTLSAESTATKMIIGLAQIYLLYKINELSIIFRFFLHSISVKPRENRKCTIISEIFGIRFAALSRALNTIWMNE